MTYSLGQNAAEEDSSFQLKEASKFINDVNSNEVDVLSSSRQKSPLNLTWLVIITSSICFFSLALDEIFFPHAQPLFLNHFNQYGRTESDLNELSTGLPHLKISVDYSNPFLPKNEGSFENENLNEGLSFGSEQLRLVLTNWNIKEEGHYLVHSSAFILSLGIATVWLTTLFLLLTKDPIVTELSIGEKNKGKYFISVV